MIDPAEEAALLTAVRAATGRSAAQVATCSPTAVDHTVENMTTRSLRRFTGTLHDGTPWSVFVKDLQPASASPLFASIPEEHHEQVLRELDWRDEPRIYRSGLARATSGALRLPRLLHVAEAPSKITLWLEDVEDVGGWGPARYRRAAHALGRLSAALPEERAAALGIARRPIDGLFHGKVRHHDIPRHADDRLWSEPPVSEVVDDRHRADLEHLAPLVPELLARLAALPHAMSHGDAAPGNLLETSDGSIVGVDWSYASCAPPGTDLAQLLAGRAESGHLRPSEIPQVARTILDGYLAGLAEGDATVDVAAVELAWATHLTVRSVFSALLVERPPGADDDAFRDLLATRAALARFGLDFAARVAAETATR